MLVLGLVLFNVRPISCTGMYLLCSVYYCVCIITTRLTLTTAPFIPLLHVFFVALRLMYFVYETFIPTLALLTSAICSHTVRQGRRFSMTGKTDTTQQRRHVAQ